MKEYTKTLPATSNPRHTESSLDSNVVGKAAKRGTAGGLSFGTLTNTQILTSAWQESHDRFLDRCFKEWEEWLQQYELTKLTRPEKNPYTPTDFT